MASVGPIPGATLGGDLCIETREDDGTSLSIRWPVSTAWPTHGPQPEPPDDPPPMA